MEDVRARLAARIENPWKHVEVPDGWLPHLAQLDAAIAAIDPNYSCRQIKAKMGSLRYYVARAGNTPDEVAWIAKLVRAAEYESPHWT